MKKLLLFFCLTFLSHVLLSQDLIITNSGDSIKCSIKSVKNRILYYTISTRDEIRSTVIPMDRVSSYKYNYLNEIENQKKLPEAALKKYKFSVTTGYSYRTAKMSESLPSNYKNYIDKLRSGMNLGLDFSYYIKGAYGIGLRYNYYHSNTKDNLAGVGDVSDNIKISFFGPAFSMRAVNPINHNCFYTSIAAGYLGYKNDSKVSSESYLIKSSTAGLIYDLGYDINVGKNTSVGLQVSYVIGTLTKLDVTNNSYTQTIELTKNEYENLSRLDFSVGLKFNW